MHLTTLRGRIARRLLVNYRVAPDVVAHLLPAPFRPRLTGGFAIAGICLIRLERLGPAGLPSFLGLSSENAALRFAVEWDDPVTRQTRTGVYIPRRDTSSCVNALVGGRAFPGTHHRARFRVRQSHDRRIHLGLRTRGRLADVTLEAFDADFFPATSVFPTIDAASEFFRSGSTGYSPAGPTRFDGIELRTASWSVRPVAIWSLHSAYFSDPSRFPPGSAQFDCALVMRNVDHSWHPLPSICCDARQSVTHPVR